jgi:hypothetical protein
MSRCRGRPGEAIAADGLDVDYPPLNEGRLVIQQCAA